MGGNTTIAREQSKTKALCRLILVFQQYDKLFPYFMFSR